MKNILIALIFVALLIPAFCQTKPNPEEEKLMKQVHQELAVNLFNQSWDVLLKAGAAIEDEGARKQFDSDMNDEYWFGMK